MESMVFDTVLICLAAMGLIVSFIKNREMDSVLVQAGDSEEKDKKEEYSLLIVEISIEAME